MAMLTNEPIIQIYRDAIPGRGDAGREDTLKRFLDGMKKDGWCEAVCFHGFATELVTHWDSLATMALGRGLKPLASWGLDTNKLGGKVKGELVGAVVSQPNCVAGLLDAEYEWDHAKSNGDLTTPEEALKLGDALRTVAPNALVGDQCWFALESHGDDRDTPGPLGLDDVFTGFPADEFAVKAVNWIRFRQAYFNNKSTKDAWGKTRWDKGEAWMDRDWKQFHDNCIKKGRQNLVRPLGITIQGYGWDDIPWVLVNVLLKYLIQNNQPVVIWCDAFPTPVVVSALRFVAFLRANGFAINSTDPRSIVRKFQTSYNATHPKTPLKVDGAGGEVSMRAAGCWVIPPTPQRSGTLSEK